MPPKVALQLLHPLLSFHQLLPQPRALLPATLGHGPLLIQGLLHCPQSDLLLPDLRQQLLLTASGRVQAILQPLGEHRLTLLELLEPPGLHLFHLARIR